jgi:hypothetical protein
MVPAPVLSSPAPIADDWRPRIAGLHPTARAIRLLVLLALAALIVAAIAPGAWTVAPAAGGALFLLILGDAALAGSVTAFRLHVPEDGEVGEALPIRVEVELSRGSPRTGPAVALATDPRLAPGGRIDIALTGASPDNGWGSDLRRHRDAAPPASPGAGCAGRGRSALPIGRSIAISTAMSGYGPISPRRAARPCRFSCAKRNRGWSPAASGAKAPSSRLWPNTSRAWIAAGSTGNLGPAQPPVRPRIRNRTQQPDRLCLRLRTGDVREPIGGLARIDRAVTAALTTAWVALKAEDRVALFGFCLPPAGDEPLRHRPHQFRRLQEAAAALDYRAEEPNFTLAMASLSARLQRRSLIVVFSDFNDPTGAELMIEMCTRLVERHRVVFVVMRDEDLDTMAEADVEAIDDAARAVVASTLIRQRALVLTRLRQAGIMVIEAPWEPSAIACSTPI